MPLVIYKIVVQAFQLTAEEGLCPDDSARMDERAISAASVEKTDRITMKENDGVWR